MFTDLELFLLSGWVSYIVIRLVADSIKLRLYIDFKARKFRVGRPTKGLKIFSLRNKSNIHIHHFIFGIVILPLSFISLYWRFWVGPVLVGVVMALIGSEVKELILMSWGQ